MKVVLGGIKTFEKSRPACIISTHSTELNKDVRKFFERLNYKVSGLKNYECELVCLPL